MLLFARRWRLSILASIRCGLVDYKVRVVNGQEGTAARIPGEHREYRRIGFLENIGVSENIIEASWLLVRCDRIQTS